MRSTGTQPVYDSRWTYTNKGLLLCEIKEDTDLPYWQNMNIDEAKNKQNLIFSAASERNPAGKMGWESRVMPLKRLVTPRRISYWRGCWNNCLLGRYFVVSLRHLPQVKGNELINILNLEAVEHALWECIQLLIEFEFWRENVPRN